MKCRIISEYPHYPGGTCVPTTIYFVEILTRRGWLFDRWTRVKGFDDYKRALELKKVLEKQ